MVCETKFVPIYESEEDRYQYDVTLLRFRIIKQLIPLPPPHSRRDVGLLQVSLRHAHSRPQSPGLSLLAGKALARGKRGSGDTRFVWPILLLRCSLTRSLNRTKLHCKFETLNGKLHFSSLAAIPSRTLISYERLRYFLPHRFMWKLFPFLRVNHDTK